jgi:hypothetical protein
VDGACDEALPNAFGIETFRRWLDAEGMGSGDLEAADAPARSNSDIKFDEG